MSREELFKLAQDAALSYRASADGTQHVPSYLPKSFSESLHFEPDEWVILAMQVAFSKGEEHLFTQLTTPVDGIYGVVEDEINGLTLVFSKESGKVEGLVELAKLTKPDNKFMICSYAYTASLNSGYRSGVVGIFVTKQQAVDAVIASLSK